MKEKIGQKLQQVQRIMSKTKAEKKEARSTTMNKSDWLLSKNLEMTKT